LDIIFLFTNIYTSTHNTGKFIIQSCSVSRLYSTQHAN